jgi:PTS system N-acetylgalactosamine-specific IIA component
MSSEARAVVAGHGEWAAGLLSAVAQITGRADVFLPMTNFGLSAQDTERKMRELMDPDAITVVFTDLPAGSCTMAARRIQRERPTVVVVMGTNLATLLDFVFQTDVPAGDAARHAAEKGRAALIVTGVAGGN